MDIALNKDFDIIKKASSTVLCNELSRCVYEGYKKSSKRNYKVTDKMISIFKFFAIVISVRSLYCFILALDEYKRTKVSLPEVILLFIEALLLPIIWLFQISLLWWYIGFLILTICKVLYYLRKNR